MTGVRDCDFAQRQSRDLRRRFGLSLLAPLSVEQSSVLDGNRRLTSDEHDQVEIMGIVSVGFVGQNLHHSDGAVVIGQGCRDLALHFTLGRDLEDRSRPPALRLG